ncbi:hypothetical protein ABN028_28090 [Actinopolymorpha sp. B17G11]|uniref:hypothetical protein n=1 Tax=unclassified Actinopolymorpha TaxID=2627063 RepID=UPI0032D93154
MTTNDTDSDVTNDTGANADTGTWRLDNNQVDKIPFAGQGVGIWKSGDKFLDDPGANWSEVASIGGSVAGMAGSVMAIGADPLNWLISQGLGFLIDWIQPLQDAIGYVTGNPERMDADMAKWARVQNALVPLSGEVRDAANAGLVTWEGEAANAAKTKLNDFADGVLGVANDVKLIQAIMGVAKMLMELAYNFVLGLIADFVEWLIMVWIPALASAPVTFGASTAAAGTATAVRAASTGSRATRFIAKVNQILFKLKNILYKLRQSGMENALRKFQKRDGGRYAGYKSAGDVVRDFATDGNRVFSPSSPGSWGGIAGGTTQAGDNVTDWVLSDDRQSDEDIERKLGGE